MRKPLALLTAALASFFSAATPAEPASADFQAPYQKLAREIFADSIARHTAAGRAQVPEYAEYLAARLRSGGFPEEDVHVLRHTVSHGEETAMLVARYRGDGSSGLEPVLLLAHMDVVTALPEAWERDPFELIEEDGYFFGRGTLDNKLGVAVLTTTFLRLREEGFVPSRDLVLAFSGDEETGMETTRELVTTYRHLTDAEYALNSDAGGGALDEKTGRPVSFALQAAEKTYATFELTVRNPGGHSSIPRADNAIYQLAAALQRIEGHRFPTRVNEVSRGYLEQQGRLEGGELGEAMVRFAADPGDADAAARLAREPALIGLTRTTCVATMLRGGHAENALPRSATATVNCRIFPGVEVEAVQQQLAAVVDDPEVEFTLLGQPTESPASPMREDVLGAVRQALAERYPDVPVIPYMAPYGTDGKVTRAHGIPTYGVAGFFMRSSDVFAHGLDERVPVTALYEALDYWHTLLTLVGRPAGLLPAG